MDVDRVKGITGISRGKGYWYMLLYLLMVLLILVLYMVISTSSFTPPGLFFIGFARYGDGSQRA